MSVRRAGVVGAGGCNPPRVINTPLLPALQSAQLTDAPRGLWPLQETSGATAFDASGNGRDGTYSGGTQGAAAIGGNGSASYTAGLVTIPYASWLDATSWTCEILVYPTTVGSYSPMGRNSSGRGILWLWTATGGVNYWYNTNGAGYYSPNGSTGLSNTTPYLLAARWDKAGATCSMWRNGVSVASVSNNGDSADTPDTVGLLLGDCRAGQYGWQGKIAFAAYYGSALSDARLLAHAQAAGLA